MADKPTAEKLGIKAGSRVYVVNPPANLAGVIGPLPDGAALAAQVEYPCPFILFFAASRINLTGLFSGLVECLQKDGMLWICWPKHASGVATDLSEDIVREMGLALGLVDVKVCSLDGTWSGLKFVYRIKDRI